jgi:hypothetical protein
LAARDHGMGLKAGYSGSMTATEAYDLTTQGGAADFARVVAACEKAGAWCLIGGLAVNTYVEPVYTLDADLVMVSASLGALAARLREDGFAIEEHQHSLNAQGAGSDLRIQFTTDARYQAFPGRAVDAVVFGVRVRVACLEDVTHGSSGLMAILGAGSVTGRRMSWI